MKQLSFKNIVIALLILILLWMQFCNRKVIEKPIVQPAKEKIVERNLQDSQRKHIYDSFEVVLKRDYKKDYQNESDLIKLLNENSELVSINDKLQKELSFPDTCKPVVDLLNTRYNNYVTQTNKTLLQSKQSISGLSQTIQNQKKYLDAKDIEMVKVIKLRDSCINDYTKLEAYAKKGSAKREFGLGIAGNSPYTVLKINPGISIYYRTKNGTQINAALYTNKQVTIGISKPLIRF